MQWHTVTMVFQVISEVMWLYWSWRCDSFLCNAALGLEGQAHPTVASILTLQAEISEYLYCTVLCIVDVERPKLFCFGLYSIYIMVYIWTYIYIHIYISEIIF